MAKRGDVFVNRRTKKPSAAIPALVVLVVSGLVALSGAYAWQALSGDQAKLEIKERRQPASSSSAMDAASASGVASASSEPAEESRPPADSAEEQVTSVATSSEALPEPTGSDDIIGSAVGKSERVASTYFDDAIFVGDSITSGILSYQIMQSTTVIAHTGINPDSIRSQKVYRDADGSLVSILDAMSKYKDTKKIYIMLGANSASWMDSKLFMQFYAEFLQSTMKQHPDAIVYVQSILPINTAKFKAGPYGAQELSNQKIQSFNKGIAEMAKSNGAYYLDVADVFRDESFEMPADATTDGMHFGTAYYQKWFDYLKTHTVQA